MKMRLSCAVLALATWMAPGSLLAQAFQNLEAVDRQVAAFLSQSPEAAGASFVPADRRLRLAPCRTALTLSWHGNQQNSVLVRCPDAGGWRLFIRVDGSTASATTPAASHAVLRGDNVTVTVRGGGFSVSQNAEALENGAVGQWIRIKINKTNEIRAQITQPGAVSVDIN